MRLSMARQTKMSLAIGPALQEDSCGLLASGRVEAVEVPTLLIRGGDTEPVIAEEDRDFVDQAMALLPEGPFDGETWGTWTAEVKSATGRKGRGLFMPLRKALTGMERGPDMSDVMPLLQVVKARR